MPRLTHLFALSIACTSTGSALSPDASHADALGLTEMPATRTAMVGLHDLHDRAAVTAGAAALGGELTWCFDAARVCLVHFPTAVALPLKALQSLPGVRYAEADALFATVPTTMPVQPTPHSFTDPAPTPECTDPWDTTAIELGAAWTTYGTPGDDAPVVSVMDSGFLTTHDDLAGAIWGQYDYGNSDSDPEVEWSSGVPAHGTFIAGVVAGRHDDGFGRSGVVPAGRLNLQKVADDNGALFFSYAVRAMGDAAQGDLGIRVVNYSIASPSTIQSFTDAVYALDDAGIVLVAAAANCGSANCSDADNDANPLYPASFIGEHIVAVAGHLRDGSLNPFSHYGATSVDLAAPGVDLCGPGVLADDNLYVSGGTSYATPLVAGTAALVLGRFPRLTPTDVARVLRASAIDEPGLAGLVRSGGRLSALRALQVAVPKIEAPVDQVIERYDTVRLELDNPGAAGTGTVVLTHGPGLELVAATDPAWTLATAATGEVIDLPDAGPHTAVDTITTLTGPLPEDGPVRLDIQVRSLDLDSHPVTARLVGTSPGTDAWLNAPYQAGTDDETGFLAYTFHADAADALPPATLDLSTTALAAGQPFSLEATGAMPGDTVWFLAGFGQGHSPCLPFDDDRCPHVVDPFPLGQATADGAGLARLTLTAPGRLPAQGDIAVQAVAPAGPDWSDAVSVWP